MALPTNPTTFAEPLLPQGVARGTDTPPPAHRQILERILNPIRTHLYRPALRLLKRTLGGVIFLREPISIAQDRTCITSYTELYPAQVIDCGNPTRDSFLRSCKYIGDGKIPRPAIFVAELSKAKFYPRLGLVFDSRWRPILESILDLGRFYNFRQQLRPRKVAKRSGTISSVHHIFQENAWHWLVDSLAQIHSLELYMAGKPLTLLMPDLLSARRRQHLELLLPPNFQVEYVPSDTWIECDHFILPSYVSSRANGWLPPAYFEFLRTRTFAGLAVEPPATATGRYYISRSRSKHRKVLNESEIMAILAPLGFECIWMEDLSFRDEVALLRTAEAIISPHGAGLACMLYGDNLKVGVLYPEAEPAGYFYTMARGLGHRHFNTNAKLREDDDFQVDLTQLQRILDEMALQPITPTQELLQTPEEHLTP
jgi:hypothetical protein